MKCSPMSRLHEAVKMPDPNLALREGAAGKTIERRVTLSESLDALDTYRPERWFVSRNPGC